MPWYLMRNGGGLPTLLMSAAQLRELPNNDRVMYHDLLTAAVYISTCNVIGWNNHHIDNTQWLPARTGLELTYAVVRVQRRVKVWLAWLEYRRCQRQRVITLLGALRRGSGADIYWISGLLRNIASFVLA